MAVYRFEQELGDDHLLRVPTEVPMGLVRVEIVAPAAADQSYAAVMEFLDARTIDDSGRRSKEDIDAYLRAERASWDE